MIIEPITKLISSTICNCSRKYIAYVQFWGIFILSRSNRYISLNITNKIPNLTWSSDFHKDICVRETLSWQLFVPSNAISLCYSYYHLTAFQNQRTVYPQFARGIPSGSVTELTLYPKSLTYGLQRWLQTDVLVQLAWFAKLMKCR